jgi:hypothetical protein
LHILWRMNFQRMVSIQWIRKERIKVARASSKSSIPVENLEFQLKRSLRPVQPDPHFVDHLHTRLRTPSITVLERRNNLVFALLLAAVSLFTGVLLLLITRMLRPTSA